MQWKHCDMVFPTLRGWSVGGFGWPRGRIRPRSGSDSTRRRVYILRWLKRGAGLRTHLRFMEKAFGPLTVRTG
jgi:hypothetical protein